MKNYDINCVWNGSLVKVIRLKLQVDDYVGYVTVKMGGNISALSIMQSIAEDIVDGFLDNDIEPNSDFRIVNDDDPVTFRAKLYRSEGDACVLNESIDDLEYFITGIELLDLEDKQEE